MDCSPVLWRLQLHGQRSAVIGDDANVARRQYGGAIGIVLVVTLVAAPSGSVDLCRLRLVGVLALSCPVSSRRNVRSNASTGKLSMCQRSRFSKRTPAGTCAAIIALQTALAHLAVKSNP